MFMSIIYIYGRNIFSFFVSFFSFSWKNIGRLSRRLEEFDRKLIDESIRNECARSEKFAATLCVRPRMRSRCVSSMLSKLGICARCALGVHSSKQSIRDASPRARTYTMQRVDWWHAFLKRDGTERDRDRETQARIHAWREFAQPSFLPRKICETRPFFSPTTTASVVNI